MDRESGYPTFGSHEQGHEDVQGGLDVEVEQEAAYVDRGPGAASDVLGLKGSYYCVSDTTLASEVFKYLRHCWCRF